MTATDYKEEYKILLEMSANQCKTIKSLQDENASLKKELEQVEKFVKVLEKLKEDMKTGATVDSIAMATYDGVVSNIQDYVETKIELGTFPRECFESGIQEIVDPVIKILEDYYRNKNGA